MKVFLIALIASLTCSMSFAQSDLDKAKAEAKDAGVKAEQGMNDAKDTIKATSKDMTDKTKMEMKKADNSMKKSKRKAKKDMEDTKKNMEESTETY